VLHIKKGAEPRWLAEYRSAQRAAFGTLSADHKKQLRELLVAEQRGLCCYCMGRISASPEVVKIEHWASQKAHSHEVLAYGNLLASCHGGEGGPPKSQHCDTRKAFRSITLDPTRPELLHTLKYLASGQIETRQDLQHEIDDVLGLNIDKLKRYRASAVQGFVESLQKKRPGDWSPQFLERQAQRLEQETPARPYLGALIYWLEKRKRVTANRAQQR
jgi:uncharacterized protein (TIGR02646 family)